MNTSEQYFDLNGTRLYCEIAGSGPAVVLIHGFTLDTRMWDDQFLPLAQQFQAIRYDLRGFGRSAAPTDEPYSHVDDLEALLDRPDFRAITEVISQQAPHARKIVVPGVGHMANMEAPDLVLRLVADFLAGM